MPWLPTHGFEIDMSNAPRAQTASAAEVSAPLTLCTRMINTINRQNLTARGCAVQLPCLGALFLQMLLEINECVLHTQRLYVFSKR